MLKLRIIPCLDVKDGKVVKGKKFRFHEIVGDIVELASYYSKEGADELVFYDITASSDGRLVDRKWVLEIAKKINIPFCVAGGISSLKDASQILEKGADKVSINSPALTRPELITELSLRFGSQCVVVGIDSFERGGDYFVYQYTGSEKKIQNTGKRTFEWSKEAVDRGAGEIVLNCMNQDGMREGYDIKQLKEISNQISVPVIASGGAGKMEHFKELFRKTSVSGALAASVFHKNIVKMKELKSYLKSYNISVRGV